MLDVGVWGYLSDWDNDEGPSSSALCHYGQELAVDGAKVVVMDVLGDGDAFEAVLPVGNFAIDVSKLGASVGRAPWHLQNTNRKEGDQKGVRMLVNAPSFQF